MTESEKLKAIEKLRTALMFWLSFQRNSRFNHRTKETIELTINCVKFVIEQLEKGKIEFKIIERVKHG